MTTKENNQLILLKTGNSRTEINTKNKKGSERNRNKRIGRDVQETNVYTNKKQTYTS